MATSIAGFAAYTAFRILIWDYTVSQLDLEEVLAITPLGLYVSYLGLLSLVASLLSQNRRTDDPNEEDRSASFSIKPDVGPSDYPREDKVASAKAFDWATTSYRTRDMCVLISCNTR